jgi:hypothetical protein
MAVEEARCELALLGHGCDATRVAPDLDRWLPSPALRTTHTRAARADAATLWAAALGVRLGDCRMLGRLVRARLGVGDAGTTFEELFARAPFVMLERGPTWALSGLCGRIWRVRGELPTLADADAFRAWREPGTVRVLFAHWVSEAAAGAEIHSEVRVEAVDARAGRLLRALEPFIASFQGLVGRESLAVAVRHAESEQPAAS